MSERYRSTSIWDTYLISRRRRPTNSSNPRREWWSCLCTLRCSVRSAIRLVSSAICASGDPVSVSCKPYWLRISFFCSAVSATNYLHQLVRDHGFLQRGHREPQHTPMSSGSLAAERCPPRIVEGWSTRREQGARPVGVLVHGGDEIAHPVELALSADACDEVQCHVLSVPRSGRVEDQRVDRAGASGEGRIGAPGHCGLVALP